jgi:hypothetical protein
VTKQKKRRKCPEDHIPATPDDFKGSWCQTGIDSGLAVAQGDNDYPTKPQLTYYIQSLPGTRGQVSRDDRLALTFQEACDEWSKYVPITFVRTLDQNTDYDFKIRTADQNEEMEKVTSVAEAFFWSDVNAKVLKVINEIQH